MIRTKYFSSSISISFASVFLFSALFAACCFTLIYLQPLQDHGSDDDHHVHDIKLVNYPPPSNRKTKMDIQVYQIEKLAVSPSTALQVDDLVSPNSPVEDEDGGGAGGVIQEVAVNSTAASNVVIEHVESTSDPPKMAGEVGDQGLDDAQDNLDVVEEGIKEPPDAQDVHSDDTVNLTTVVEDGNQGLIEQQLGNKEPADQQVVNSIATTVVEDGKVEDGDLGLVDQLSGNNYPVDQQVVDSTATAVVEDGKQGLVEQHVNSGSAAPTVDPWMKMEDAEDDEEVESTPAGVDPFKPPHNVTVDQRKAWFKESVPKMKVFESTKKTRVFEQRIQRFFVGCKGKFFMTWITPSRLFGKREMFALESVLKVHPKGCVVIASKSMDSKRGRSMLKPMVDLGYKVLPVAPDLPLLFNDTPAGPWLTGLKAGEIDPGWIPITQSLSNLLRLVLLYKYGGIYLDVDVIVIKDFTGLKNTIGIQSVDEKARIWKSVNNAVLIFDRKHPLLYKLIDEFAANFNGNIWGHNGPYMFSRVIMKLAFKDPAYDFNIMSPTAFYPVDWVQIPRYFRQPKDANETQWTYDEDYVLEQRSYAVHLWNKNSRHLKIEHQSLIGRLISDHCILCKDIYD